MRAVVQRVSRAKVTIDGKVKGEIGRGILVLLGIMPGDNEDIIKWFCNKLVNLRIFNDADDKMNLSVTDIGGGILIISNFTLYGDAKKGFRPSYTKAAPPEIAEPIYYKMVEYLKNNYSLQIETGEFGAMMDVELVNDGPVTILIKKENQINL